ncbi:MAG: right-handed parallel beta-helix repeat-containing protein [Eubacterium sp.]|nr:right-handed parallel beta-helix repeat-containing protein [Eubacterium sp.]
MKRMFKCVSMMALIAGICLTFMMPIEAKMKVTVSPKSLNKQAKKNFSSKYDKSIAHCLALNQTIEKMRKKGGGTLTLKKGTYRLQYAVCIPSNVTLVFKNGVVVENIMNKKAHIKPASLMFQIAPKNKTKKKKSIGKYNGTSKAKLIGEGKVVFKMNYIKGVAINVVHCKNIEISGITFKGMNGNHYIETNAAKNVNIHDCKFTKAKKGTLKSAYVKEAINIDLPDPTTHGSNSTWAKQDLTPCKNISVKNCTFEGMSRGVGTHNYSQKNGQNIYHSKIVIEGNTFKNLFDAGVYLMNWQDVVIKNNTFYMTGKDNTLDKATTAHAIAGAGVKDIHITGNSFTKIKKNPIYFAAQENVGNGSHYKRIYVYITDEEAKEMVDNTSTECGKDPNFPGYDVVYLRGDGRRTAANAVGINFNKKEVCFQMEKTK